MSEEGTIAPMNIEAEQALLGKLLCENNAYWRVAERLSPGDFFDPFHARIFEAIAKLSAQDRAVMPISVLAAMEGDKAFGLPDFDARAYVANLVQVYGRGSIHALIEHAATLRELASRRRIVTAAAFALEAAQRPLVQEGETAEKIAEKAADELFEATRAVATGEGAVSIKDLAYRAARSAEAAMNQPAGVCLSSGLYDVDEKLGGLYRGDLTVLGGAPNMGKTSLAQHIAKAIGQRALSAPDGEKPGDVLFFSLEMMAEQVATRELAAKARVPSDRIRRGRITHEEAERLALAAHQFPDLPYKIDGDRRLSVAQMRARAQAARRRSPRGLAMVGIDHLRFIRPANPKDSEPEQIQQITRDLKDMAADLNVALLLVSHLNRESNKRENKRPQLTDLYGSSAIEQNADAVWFIHREIYFLRRSEPDANKDMQAYTAWMSRCEKEEGWAEIFAAKQRMGPIGSARVRFDEQYTEFSDAEARDPGVEQAAMELWQSERGYRK